MYTSPTSPTAQQSDDRIRQIDRLEMATSDLLRSFSELNMKPTPETPADSDDSFRQQQTIDIQSDRVGIDPKSIRIDLNEIDSHRARRRDNTKTEETKTTTAKSAVLRVFSTIKLLDAYGESVVGPGLRTKTWPGVLLTAVFRAVVVGVIAYNIYLLARKQRSEMSGGRLSLNYEIGDKYYFDIPTCQLNVSQKLYFFEKNSPSLQRLNIKDVHGFEHVLSSNSDPHKTKIPMAKAIVGQSSIPLNSLIPDVLQDYDPIEIRTKALSSSSIFRQDQVQLRNVFSDESIHDTLMFLHISNELFPSANSAQSQEIYSHSTHLFLRFKPEQLSRVKACQLQVGMFSKGDFLASYSSSDLPPHIYWKRSYQTTDFLRSFSSSNSTWVNDSPDFTLLALSNKYTIDDALWLRSQQQFGEERYNVTQFFEDGDVIFSAFTSWEFFINYVPNFMFTLQSHYCEGRPIDFRRGNIIPFSFMDQSPSYELKVLAPQNLDTKLFFVVTRGVNDFIEWMDQKFASGMTTALVGPSFVSEIVTIESVHMPEPATNNDTSAKWGYFTISRGGPSIDFRKAAPSTNEDLLAAMLSQSSINGAPTVPPISWTCDSSRWNDGRVCDCDCGASDPDCSHIMPTIFDNLDQYGSLMSPNTEGYLCSVDGKTFEIPTIKAGPLCTNSLKEGTQTMVGHFGLQDSLQGMCPACPNSPMLNNEPEYIPELGKYMCNYPISGKLDLSYFYQNNTYEPKCDGNECTCGFIRVLIESGRRGFPTDPAFSGYSIIIGHRRMASVAHASQISISKKKLASGSFVGTALDSQLLCINIATILDSIGHGRMLSNLNSRSKFIIVQKEVNPAHTGNEFWETWDGVFGAFSVEHQNTYASVITSEGLQSVEIVIEAVEVLDDIQILYLKSPPTTLGSTNYGYKTDVIAISSDRLTVTVPFDTDLDNVLQIRSSGLRATIRTRDIELRFALCTINAYGVVSGQIQITCSEALADFIYPRDILELGVDMNDAEFDIRVVESNVGVKLVLQDTDPYDPADVNAKTAPQVLDIDYALFTVPSRLKWTDDYSLMPKEASFEVNGDQYSGHPVYGLYKLKDDRRHKVTNYSLTDFDSSTCDTFKKNAYRLQDCVTEMPPAKIIEYTHIVQVNNKWDMSRQEMKQIRTKTGVETPDPEHTLHFQHEYLFSHDDSVEKLEKQFASWLDPKRVVDIDQNKDEQFSYGRYYFSDSGISTAGYLGANNPFLETLVQIQLSPFAVADALEAKPIFHRLKGTWRSAKKKNLEKFIRSKWSDLQIHWDMTRIGGLTDKVLSIRPGVKYTLYANIQAYSNCSKGTFGAVDISNFLFRVVSTQVSQQSLPYQYRNRAVMEFYIQIQDDDRLIHNYDYNIFNFLSSLGGAVSLTTFGMIVLSLIQKVFPPMSVIPKLSKVDEQIERKKKMKNIARRMSTVFAKSPLDSPTPDY